MLDPIKLQKVPDELVEYYEDLETDILKDIAERLSLNNFMLSPTTLYRTRKLKELGLQYDDVVKRISQAMNVSEAKVKKAITENVYEGVQSDVDLADEHGLFDGSQFDKGELKEHITAGVKRLDGELKNITRSMAAASNSTYEKLLDEAYMKVRSGAYSYQEAIDQAVDILAKKGMETFTYKSGHRDRVSTVVRRAVLSGVNMTTIKAQLENLSNMGMNLVRTTQHLGARPTHEVWQGKTFYYGEPVEGYQSLEEGTGYGTGDGLGGWNCRHGIRIALEELGISYTEEPIDTEENNRIYELEQKQRYNERMIREWKRRVEIKKAASMDYGYELNYLKKWQKIQEDFIKENPELKRQENREGVEKIYNQKPLNKVLDSIKSNDSEQYKNKETIDPNLKKEINNGVSLMLQQFPKCKQFIHKAYYRRNSEASYALTETKIENHVITNDIIFGARFSSNRLLDLGIQREIASGYWYKGINAKSLVVHELTHILEVNLTLKKLGINPNYVSDDEWNLFVKEYGSISKDILVKALSKLNVEIDSKECYNMIEISLGKYALDNTKEVLAQSVSQYLTTDNPTKLSKEIYKLLKEIYDDTYSGI